VNQLDWTHTGNGKKQQKSHQERSNGKIGTNMENKRILDFDQVAIKKISVLYVENLYLGRLQSEKYTRYFNIESLI
jgi:hypothetical protein